MILKLVLVLSSAIISNSQEDYCAIQNEKCGIRPHIRCNMNKDTTGQFYPGRLLTNSEQMHIVNTLNEYRAKYQKGAIEWNTEFEYVAKAFFFVSKNVFYCYATQQFSNVFTIDYRIIYGLDRNINKWIECLIETNANVLRVAEITQIGCIVYSRDLTDRENPFLHDKYNIFCILNGEMTDEINPREYNTCIEGKRDKNIVSVDNVEYSSLMINLSIWVLLVIVFYLIGQISVMLHAFTKNRDLIIKHLKNKYDSNE